MFVGARSPEQVSRWRERVWFPQPQRTGRVGLAVDPDSVDPDLGSLVGHSGVW